MTRTLPGLVLLAMLALPPALGAGQQTPPKPADSINSILEGLLKKKPQKQPD